MWSLILEPRGPAVDHREVTLLTLHLTWTDLDNSKQLLGLQIVWLKIGLLG
jgi:hypothetical protein